MQSASRAARSRAAWTITRVRCGYSIVIMLSSAASRACRPSYGRQPLAVGLEVGVDHRQPGRRRGRVLRLLGRAGSPRQDRPAPGRGDRPGPRRRLGLRSAAGDLGLRARQPLGVEQGAGLEDAMGRTPLVLGQRAELRVRPRQRRQPRRRFAVGADRLVQGPHGGEVVNEAELIEPLLDVRRHRSVVAILFGCPSRPSRFSRAGNSDRASVSDSAVSSAV